MQVLKNQFPYPCLFLKKDILKFLWNKDLKFCKRVLDHSLLSFAKKLKSCWTLHKFRSSTLTLQHFQPKIKLHLDSLSSKCQQSKNRKFPKNQKRVQLNQKCKFKIRLFFQYLAQSAAAFTAVARSYNQASCKEKTQSLQIITSTTTSRAVEAQSEDRQEGAIKQCVCYSYYLPLLTSLLLSSR